MSADELREARSRQQFKATLALREIVLAGGIEPGERVGEIALAERLGVSRTPLRLALGELAHEGLLQDAAHRRFRGAGVLAGGHRRRDRVARRSGRHRGAVCRRAAR